MDDFSYFRLRIPLELKEKIEKESKKNNRSMNAEILKIIENYLEQKEKSKLYKQIALAPSFPEAIQKYVENSIINPSKQSPKEKLSILFEKIDKINDDLNHIKEKLNKK